MKFLLILLAFGLFTTSSIMALEVSPDGPRIVSLNEDAASVIVGNPAHATVILDNPRLMIITAGIPGMTRLTVLGRDGKVIMGEDIIVNGPSIGMVRVRNACINGGENCQPTRMYHCVEGRQCHNVIVNEPTVSGNGGAAAGSASTSGVPSLEGAVAEDGV